MRWLNAGMHALSLLSNSLTHLVSYLHTCQVAFLDWFSTWLTYLLACLLTPPTNFDIPLLSGAIVCLHTSWPTQSHMPMHVLAWHSLSLSPLHLHMWGTFGRQEPHTISGWHARMRECFHACARMHARNHWIFVYLRTCWMHAVPTGMSWSRAAPSWMWKQKAAF